MIPKKLVERIVSQVTSILQEEKVLGPNQTLAVNIQIVSNPAVLVTFGAEQKDGGTILKNALARMQRHGPKVGKAIRSLKLSFSKIQKWREPHMRNVGAEAMEEFANALKAEGATCEWIDPFLTELSSKRGKKKEIEKGQIAILDERQWQVLLEAVLKSSREETHWMKKIIESLNTSGNKEVLASEVLGDIHPTCWKIMATYINQLCERHDLLHRVRFVRTPSGFMRDNQYTEVNVAKRLDGTYQIVTIAKL